MQTEPKQPKRQLRSAILILIGCTGCATPLEEIRVRPPRHALVVAGGYLQIANCVTYGLEMNRKTAVFLYRGLDAETGKRAHVTGSAVGLMFHPGATTVLAISFQQAADTVRIESRTASGPGGWGYIAEKIEPEIWPIRERMCRPANDAAIKPLRTLSVA